MKQFGEFVIYRQKMRLIVMAMITLILIAKVPVNHRNDDFVKYFSDRIEFRRDAGFASKHLSGLYMINYSLDSNLEDLISSPEFLQQVERFASWFASQPEIIRVNTITHTLKHLNESMHGNSPAWYVLPDSREMAAQYLLLYEMSLPYRPD